MANYNTLGICFNEYMLNELPALEPNIKFFNPYENTLDKAFVNYNNKFEKPSPTTQISGSYLYNLNNGNDKNDYANTNNLYIKPLEYYNGVGGFRTI